VAQHAVGDAYRGIAAAAAGIVDQQQGALQQRRVARELPLEEYTFVRRGQQPQQGVGDGRVRVRSSFR
jgi:hypothetical protein